MTLSVDRYLSRIGYPGAAPATPTRDALDTIVAHHTDAIPFENLDPFLGTPVRIDLDSIQAKLVERKRGGYCFEHNLLLAAVLTALGYDVTRLAARVLWGKSPDVTSMRTHMLLLVRVAGDDTPRVVDVGFGGMTMSGSIALTRGDAQATPLEPFRLVDLDGDYALQGLVGDEWRWIYRFDLHPEQPIDYEPVNWYLSTSPDSHFVTGLMAARVTEGRRLALAGTRFTVHAPEGSTRRELANADELREVLAGEFGIDVAGLDGLDDAFARLG
ncbi:arylamine N-acetyltransferase [Rhodococcus sp. HNM0569]|uniref:arylamine N-acetyltransferase family protein n=1 Tax=Rhodococcus sp. HNM0569 TaxID=2716340 RepID=UPI001469EC69|nr:arylamine N-acetyltransferase [Rhodococcus sp. HNM0569]NLU84345.1 arylamine N-acetyltransferase [Rhodococcus sp. HNM0569]